VRDGCDGTWVAHPDLVPVAREVFGPPDAGANQIGRCANMSVLLRDDLLKVHHGTKTEEGFPPQHPCRRAIRRGVAARRGAVRSTI